MIDQVIIRVDASLQMGTGHVMRCLTLADSLREEGATVRFICKKQNGDLRAQIKSRGYQVFSLKPEQACFKHDCGEVLAHRDWLDSSQQDDAFACKAILRDIQPDWLIVDHYSLDHRWESVVKTNCKKLMVIDDLADREHSCDLLLDQTHGRKESDYFAKVPEHAVTLIGAQYALLRPEFAQWRKFSLEKRLRPRLRNMLVNLGGTDLTNKTEGVLKQIAACFPTPELHVTVVLGATSPHLKTIRQLASSLPYHTEILSNVSNMAELMANADLAVGAAGASTWERCCLGLPSIMVILADNQKYIAQVMREAYITETVEDPSMSDLCAKIDKMSLAMAQYSKNAASVTDGEGSARVAAVMGTLM
jgi:UDP-2,4-diacetamido-2,4,6-trideoxy-beta-L-altropyranose hydrolase